jgi:hypothetical protein
VASNITLTELRAQSRATADMQNSGFVTETELDQYINLAAQTLYDLLVSRYEDYYMVGPTTFTITSPSVTYDLPADFYKLRGVDTQNAGSQWAPMRPFTFQERNMLENPLLSPVYDGVTSMYRLRANKLQILSGQFTTFTGRLWYIPTMTKLVSGSDTFDGINGFERHIILSVAIMMKQKEESDARLLVDQVAAIEDRIKAMGDNRDAGSPDRVTDVTQLGGYGPWGRY